MPEPVLLVERSQRVATLTLNRPDAMNALSRELSCATAAAANASVEASDIEARREAIRARGQSQAKA